MQELRIHFPIVTEQENVTTKQIQEASQLKSLPIDEVYEIFTGLLPKEKYGKLDVKLLTEQGDDGESRQEAIQNLFLLEYRNVWTTEQFFQNILSFLKEDTITDFKTGEVIKWMIIDKEKQLQARVELLKVTLKWLNDDFMNSGEMRDPSVRKILNSIAALEPKILSESKDLPQKELRELFGQLFEVLNAKLSIPQKAEVNKIAKQDEVIQKMAEIKKVIFDKNANPDEYTKLIDDMALAMKQHHETLLLQIPLKELFKTQDPNNQNWINFVNYTNLSPLNFVHLILHSESAAERVMIRDFLIDLANKSRIINDFEAINILSIALQQAPIARLSEFKGINIQNPPFDVQHSAHNFKIYRDLTKATEYVPMPHIVSKDLLAIRENNENYIDGGLSIIKLELLKKAHAEFIQLHDTSSKTNLENKYVF